MGIIKNIIFDFGQVIIDIDPPGVINRFREKIGADDFERFYNRLHERNIFDRLEINDLSAEAFIHAFQQESEHRLSAIEILDIWNSMIVGIPAHRLLFLEKLKEDYQIYLLSNTNGIHLEIIYKHLEKDHGVSDFDQRFFHNTYYSHVVRMRKPDLKIYEHVLQDAGIKAEETLFVDDKVENIEAAAKLGIRGAHHDPDNEIVDVFEGYLK